MSNLVETRRAEFITMGAEPNLENVIISIINDTLKRYIVEKKTDEFIARIKSDILADCAPYISDLDVEDIVRTGKISFVLNVPPKTCVLECDDLGIIGKHKVMEET